MQTYSTRALLPTFHCPRIFKRKHCLQPRGCVVIFLHPGGYLACLRRIPEGVCARLVSILGRLLEVLSCLHALIKSALQPRFHTQDDSSMLYSNVSLLSSLCLLMERRRIADSWSRLQRQSLSHHNLFYVHCY
jgi:hypothetical protein